MDSEHGGAGEILRTVGLLLNFTAIIGFALFVSALGTASPNQSYMMGGITVATFVASLLCLAADQQGDEPAPQS